MPADSLMHQCNESSLKEGCFTKLKNLVTHNPSFQVNFPQDTGKCCYTIRCQNTPDLELILTEKL